MKLISFKSVLELHLLYNEVGRKIGHIGGTVADTFKANFR
jgi:hypothetical protein